jgi:hypothetical protein
MDQQPFGVLDRIDFSFFHRVYRTSVLVAVVLGMAVWGRFGPPAAAGWAYGAALSVALLVGVEWSVRRFVRAGAETLGPLVGFSMLKLFVISGGLFFAFYAATRGWLSLLFVLGGFSLPPLIILLKFAGRKLADAARPSRGGTRPD